MRMRERGDRPSEREAEERREQQLAAEAQQLQLSVGSEKGMPELEKIDTRLQRAKKSSKLSPTRAMPMAG